MPAPVFTRPGLTGAAVLTPIDQLMERPASIKEYGSLFASAIPEKGMNSTTPAEAIATYERTVASWRTPFDAWCAIHPHMKLTVKISDRFHLACSLEHDDVHAN